MKYTISVLVENHAGVLSKVGGAAYLHSLIASVPTAANAAYYARIVRERAIMRRLVTAGTRVVQLGYADAGGEWISDNVALELVRRSIMQNFFKFFPAIFLVIYIL